MRKAIQIGLVAALALAAASAPARAESAAAPAGAAYMLAEAAGGSHGGASGGYLGVDLRDLSQDELAGLKLKDAHGAEIVAVDHDAPAGKAGLREHDVVLQLNGQLISTKEQISRLLRECAPGRIITLLISRDGQQMTVTAQMSTLQQVDRQAWEQHVVAPDLDLDPGAADASATGAPAASSPQVRGGNSFIGSVLTSSTYTGAMLEKMPAQLADYFGAAGGHGLLVSSVKPNSPASFAGMHAGDVIVRANGRSVATSSDWTKAIKSSKGKPFNVVVLRDKREQTLTLTPDAHKRSGVEFPVLEIEHKPEAIAHLGLTFVPGS